MGKTNESTQKRYRNNVRVDPATLSHFLCYYCGKSSSNRMDYQIHMLKVHEVMTQSYQLWSDHTMDELGLRWSETKGQSDREASCSLPSSPVSRESKARNSEDDDEDYVCEDEKPSKRRKKDEERAKKSSAEKQRKQAIVRQKSEVDRAKKEEEKRVNRAKRDEAKRIQEAAKRAQQQADLQAAHEMDHKDGKRMSLMQMGEMEMQQRGMEASEKKKSSARKKPAHERAGVTPMAEADKDQQVADLVSSILSETRKKETSSQEVMDEDLNPEIIDRKPFDYTKGQTKYCKVCKKGTHYTFDTLFEHYQDHHHAVIKSFNYYGYRDKTLIGKKTLIAREYCQRCVKKFDSSRAYYSHMIQYHIHESVRCQLDFETANNADIEVNFLFRDRTLSIGFNFYFEDNAGLSNAEIADFQAGTIPVDINQPSTSGLMPQQLYADRQIKQEPAEQFEGIKQEPPF